MTVYIDVLITINIYITYFTLRAAAALLHCKAAFPRLAAASVSGGLSALAALLNTDILVSLTIKTALTVLTVLIAFGFGSVKKLALRSFVCVSVSMLICGAAVLLREFTGTDVIFTANGYVCLDISALVLVVSTAVIYGILCLLRRIFDDPANGEPVTLAIKANGGEAALSAMPDSGCLLRDFLTGKPVVICDPDALESVLPPSVRAYLGGSTDDMTGIRLIPLTTAAGSSTAAAFRADSVTATFRGTSKQLDVLIGVCPGALQNEPFDALIDPKLLF
ncbi:MAG: sigma-E processing peptidase SpoIIGA [Ruminiclostridium sp.]|nr:sigma-E processing peptidase SpoIIGA [Ruminiclostridium sp.]